jgi:Tol biopolymer transport system component
MAAERLLLKLAVGFVALLTAGCADTRGPARLDGCPGCSVRAVVGWRDGGRKIVFTTSSRRYLVGVDAKGLRRLPWNGPAKRSRAWSRSGDRFAYAKRGWIVVRARSGRLIGSTTDLCCWDEIADSDPSWSPNGKLILFSRFVSDSCGFCFFPGDSESFTALAVARPDGSGFHWVTSDHEDGDVESSGRWSPDGRRIGFATHGKLYVVDVNRRGSATGPPRTLVLP